MEANEYTEIIRQKLDRLNVNMDTLPNFMVNHLINIEQVISGKRIRRDELLQEISRTNYDVKSISEETNISRTTFYSYEQLLKRYVQLSHETDYQADAVEQIRQQKATIKDLKEQIHLMESRDLKELQLESENSMLKKQIAEKNKLIDFLKMQLRHN